MSTETTERPLPDVIRRAAGIEMRSVDDLARMANAIAGSGYFKDGKQPITAAGVYVKMLFAMTMGFDPIAGLTGVDLIDGDPAPNAHFWAAAIEDSPLYDYEVLERTSERCTIAFFRRQPDGSWRRRGEVTWTIEDAKAAGLADKDNWRKYPRSMLHARAMTEGGRAFCPGLFGGVRAYGAEELAPDAPPPHADFEVDGTPADSDPPVGGGMVTPAAGVPRSPSGTGGSSAGAGTRTPAADPPAGGGDSSASATAGAPAQGSPSSPAPPAAGIDGQALYKSLFRELGIPVNVKTIDKVGSTLKSLGITELGQLADAATMERARAALRAQFPTPGQQAVDEVMADVDFPPDAPPTRGYTKATKATKDEGPIYQIALPSASEPGAVRGVVLRPDGRHSCTCQHGQTRKRGVPASCRHVEEALVWLARDADEIAELARDFAGVLALEEEPAAEDEREQAADRAWAASEPKGGGDG